MWKYSTKEIGRHCKKYCTALKVSKRLQVGDSLGRFRIEQHCEVPEFDLVATKLRHASGAQMLHLHSSDTNNTFSAGFRTIPLDNTGLPHILEHTVLCGSKSYPCRDPFFKMLNRSLASFMNAMTGPDYTIYPFSSQVPADIANLRSVYLDAVFRPNLTIEDFQQEGWRLEHENPHDPTSPIQIKGVVFNEMKGVFSDNQSLFFEQLLNTLLPSHTYGVCSGGDPLVIPKLTHADLVKFHKDHYAAWNARFFSYGSLPVEEHIRDIEEYLNEHESDYQDPAKTAVPPEIRWTEPRSKHIICRNDPLAVEQEKQSSIVLSYLCCDVADMEETLILQMLAELLLKGPNASFYSPLIGSNIGAGLSPVCGYEGSTKDTFLSIGLQGVSPSDFDRVEHIVAETIKGVVENGFKTEHVAAVLHQLELGLKQRSSNFGLGLLFGITPIWNHDGDVIAALQVEQRISRLRNRLANEPRLLQKKVEQYLLNNLHKLKITMSPDEKFEEMRREEENALLKDKLRTLTVDDQRKIYEDGLKLLKLKEVDNRAILPTLKTCEIPKELPSVERKLIQIDRVPVTLIDQPTNGISYFRAILPLAQLNDNLLDVVPIFANILSEMGTGKKEFRELDQWISLHTGGLDATPHVLHNIASTNEAEESLAIGSCCLDRNVDVMFQLWKEILQEVNLEDSNVARLETLLRQEAAGAVNQLAHSGHRVACLSAASLVNGCSNILERHTGMTYITQLQRIAGAAEQKDGFAQLLEKLRQIAEWASRGAAGRVMVTRRRPELVTGFDVGMKAFGDAQDPLFKTYHCLQNDSNRGLFYQLPFDVSFAAKAVQAVPYEHEDFAALRVLTRFLSMKYLHPEIREKGGAYGSGVSLNANGVLTWYSYRDPNPANTFEVFDNTLSWIAKSSELTEEDVEEAKLGVFQSVDAPVAAGEKGCLQFLQGVSNEALRRHRHRLFQVTVDDLRRVAEKYLSPERHTGRCLLGPENPRLSDDNRYKFVLK